MHAGKELSPLLQVRNLSVVIEHSNLTSRILQKVSFRIHHGKTLALLGESGSGKTMTALAILGLLPKKASVVDGEICVAGQQLCSGNIKSFDQVRGNLISMIFQEPASALNPVFQVGKQILDVIKTHQQVSKRTAREHVLHLFEQVGLPKPGQVYRAYPHQLSGGMAQRVMIAMALSCNPKLVIADEPTTALDVTTQLQILGLLTHLQKEHGFAILLISHDINVVARLADSIIVMHAGQIVERGHAKQIISNPRDCYTQKLINSNLLLPKKVSGIAHDERQTNLTPN